jgi:hypothetical protein
MNWQQIAAAIEAFARAFGGTVGELIAMLLQVAVTHLRRKHGKQLVAGTLTGGKLRDAIVSAFMCAGRRLLQKQTACPHPVDPTNGLPD